MNEINLFNLREYNDLSQEEIATSLNIKRQTYSLWETKTKIVPLKHLNTLCNFYNVSMDYMLGLSKQKTIKRMKKPKDLNKIEIGKRIKEVRLKYKLSTRDLAKFLNTTASTISAYENGKTLILTAFAYQICKKFKISLDWLCGRSRKKYL